MSTMYNKIITLANSYREILKMMNIVSSDSEAVGLPMGETTMNVSIQKYNYGAFVLAETLPPQFTPRINMMKNKRFGFVRR